MPPGFFSQRAMLTPLSLPKSPAHQYIRSRQKFHSIILHSNSNSNSNSNRNWYDFGAINSIYITSSEFPIPTPAMVKPTTSSIPDRTSDAKFTGVRKRKWGKWVSEIRLPNSRERIWLGSYDTPEKAARAFDAALFCLRGSTAKFNFPDQPPDIPGGRSLPPSQIQAVAARFAKSHDTNCTTTTTTTTTHDIDNSSSSWNSSQLQTDSPSTDGGVQTDHGESLTSQLDLTSPFLDDFTDYMNLDNSSINGTAGVPDFGIYPGFDDYFMPSPPTIADDYGEAENFDGIILQGSSFLWNF